MPKDKRSIDKLVKKLKPLIKEIKLLQDEAKSLGLFAHHRELAECPDCQLVEDVTYQGKLLVYRGDNYYEDTGLRFKELKNNAVQCPECGKVFCPYEAHLFED